VLIVPDPAVPAQAAAHAAASEADLEANAARR
jgi:hypothetical protein